MIKIKEAYINEILKENNNKHLSLRKIREIYYQKAPETKFSIETLRKFMRCKMKLTFRKPQLKHENLMINKYRIMLNVFLKKLILLLVENVEFVYIDECNFSNSHSKNKTWISKINEEAKSYPGRLKSMTLIAAITEKKVLANKVFENTVKSKDFIEFLREIPNFDYNTSDDSKLSFKPRRVLYLDNANIHCSKEALLYLTKSKTEVIFGMPYSLWYNPIELFFEDIKQEFYLKVYKTK